MADTSLSSSVDLSRLPAPSIVETLSYETIRADMIADLQARGSWDAIVESDPAVMVLEVAAYREMLIRQSFNDRARRRLLAFATGSDLDHIAAPFGVFRLDGESDSAFLDRILLAPDSYSVAGPEAAYRFHARSASVDVLDASAISPTPGTVLVTILSAVGDGTASPALVAAVTAQLATSREVRPLTDQVSVQSAEVIPFAIRAEVWTYQGPDSPILLALGQKQLATYLASVRRLGLDVTDSGIKAALHVSGVQRVELPGWSDIVCDDTQAAHCTAIDVIHAGYAA